MDQMSESVGVKHEVPNVHLLKKRGRMVRKRPCGRSGVKTRHSSGFTLITQMVV